MSVATYVQVGDAGPRDTPADSPRDITALLREQASRTPEAVALRHGGVQLSYGALDRRVEALARTLAERGMVRGQVVGHCMPRSVDAVVGLLAILRGGATVCPLDRAQPLERLAFIVADAGCASVLSDAATDAAAFARGVPVLRLDADDVVSQVNASTTQTDSSPSAADDIALPATDGAALPTADDAREASDALCYIVYTSGSTGRPKGVEMTGRAIANLLAWQARRFARREGVRCLQLAPSGFDVAFQEILSTLVTGGELVLVDDEDRVDAFRLLERMREAAIERVFLPFVALQQLALAARTAGRHPCALREVIAAGEALRITPDIESLFLALPGCTLDNQYGPSETHVVTACLLDGRADRWDRTPPIGTAIDEVSLHVLDAAGHEVPAGEEGELHVGGIALARGYVGRPELTAERFRNVASAAAGAGARTETGTERLYATGDRVRRDAAGVCRFLGRADAQLKLDGHRIECGEVEALLGECAGVAECAVGLAGGGDDAWLAAWVVPAAGATMAEKVWRDELARHLPAAMIPGAWYRIDALPLTVSGKLDRRALVPTVTADAPPVRASGKALRDRLGAHWCRLLRRESVSAHESFFDLGGSSVLALRLVATLRAEEGVRIGVADLFAAPTLAGLVSLVENAPATRPVEAVPADAEVARAGADCRAADSRAADALDAAETDDDGAIAVIGMAVRVPGARDLEAFRDLLAEGREGIRHFTREELRPYVDAALLDDPGYVRARGVIDDADAFDAAFFGMPPREAEITDPQQRVLLESCWHAIEHAGLRLDAGPNPIGVFAGVGNNGYYRRNVLSRADVLERVGEFQAMLGNEKDYVATRIAHRLRLTGPAISVHTACSTSLVAIVEACHALRARRCDVALAGAASVQSPQWGGHLHEEGSILSSDGRCRPFDAAADGTVFSDGAGVVVLKRLADALADGDEVHAIVRGIASNNDGGGGMSFMSPSPRGQAAVVRAALDDAGVDGAGVDYVEAHGTATPIGDPIEVRALQQAFVASGDAGTRCAIGSVKGNIGHLSAAAGVAGFIKTCLALGQDGIPASLHFERANPAIDLDATVFRVAAAAVPWPSAARPRRAGVSSFGVGGTNAHVVLEAAPPREAVVTVPDPEAVQLLVWSARGEAALDAIGEGLVRAESNAAISRADLAFSAQTRRTALPWRRFCTIDARTPVADAVAGVASAAPRSAVRPTTGRAPDTPPPVAFMFPGQGSQYAGMGRDLARTEPVFRDAMERCFAAFEARSRLDLRAVMWQRDERAAAAALAETRHTQPALFAIGWSLAQLWMDRGVRPAALIGHSVGEYAAACLAGVFSLEDGAWLVAERGRLIQSLPPGAMLSVALSAEALEARLPEGCSIAAINAAELVVAAGPIDAIADLGRSLEAERIACRALPTSHAFHSPMMDPIVEPFARCVASVPRHAPTVPVLSTALNLWLDEAQASSVGYWSNHLRLPVRFADGIRSLWAEDDYLLLELGPRASASALARRQATRPEVQVAVPSLADEASEGTEARALLEATGSLWMRGVEPDWRRLPATLGARARPLPGYPFRRERCWLEPGKSGEPGVQPRSRPPEPSGEAATNAGTTNMQTIAIADTTADSTRRARLVAELRELFEETSGCDLSAADERVSFLELGLDSLFLTQAGTSVKRRFKVPVTFRQLQENFTTLGLLAEHLDAELPVEAPVESPVETGVAPPAGIPAGPAIAPVRQPVALFAGGDAVVPAEARMPPAAPAGGGSLHELMLQQTAILARQLDLLQGVQATSGPRGLPANEHRHPTRQEPIVSALPGLQSVASGTSAPTAPPAPFGAQARISLSASADWSDGQSVALDEFTAEYVRTTAASKRYAQRHRAHLADPRTVTGFSPKLKELTYPIVVERSRGARLTDIDGNDWIDITNGFGANLLGHSSPAIMPALYEQLGKGVEIGPQTPLAGEVAELLCGLTGHERAALCNTGSEAVLGAMRVARTVTGRDLIACFEDDYHGMFDEVIVRGSPTGRTFAAAPGIPAASVSNMLVLEYGSDAALETLRERGEEIAAVLVEPVQSRHPDLQPRDFLHALRALSTEIGAALIMDEVITGFRVHLGGAQAHFGVKGDMATYGKIVGGGMPIGVIAGSTKYMDALDGGHWQFGDDSTPGAGVTYFAGTFVRHPLAMAAARATLAHLKQEGPALQESLNARTAGLVERMNATFAGRGVAFHVERFGSLFKLRNDSTRKHAVLLFHWLRKKRLHIWDGRPCFLSTAHEDADIRAIGDALEAALDEMHAAGLSLHDERGATEAGREAGHDAGRETGRGTAPDAPGESTSTGSPPMAGARLGIDERGEPCWFEPDAVAPGGYRTLRRA